MVIILVALPLLLICLVAVPWGLAMTVWGMARHRRAPAVRGLAIMCAAVGVGLYAVALSLVAIEQNEASHGTDSSPAPACRRANFATTVTAHEAGYFPVRFNCVLADGTTRSAGVIAWWLTPASLVLTVVGGGLWLERHRKPPVGANR